MVTARSLASLQFNCFMKWQKLSNSWESRVLFSPSNVIQTIRLQMCCPFTVTWQSQILMLGFSIFKTLCFLIYFLWDRWNDLTRSLVSEILFKSVSDFEQVMPIESPVWEPEQDGPLERPKLFNIRPQTVTEIRYLTYRLWQWREDQTRVSSALHFSWNVLAGTRFDWESPESRRCCSSQPRWDRKGEGLS